MFISLRTYFPYLHICLIQILINYLLLNLLISVMNGENIFFLCEFNFCCTSILCYIYVIY